MIHKTRSSEDAAIDFQRAVGRSRPTMRFNRAEVLEPIRRQLGVAHPMLDVAMAFAIRT
jgi:hypothetical protein